MYATDRLYRALRGVHLEEKAVREDPENAKYEKFRNSGAMLMQDCIDELPPLSPATEVRLKEIAASHGGSPAMKAKVDEYKRLLADTKAFYGDIDKKGDYFPAYLGSQKRNVEWRESASNVKFREDNNKPYV